MDNSIKLIVHRGSIIFDRIIVTPYFATKYEARQKKFTNQIDGNIGKINENNKTEINKICLNKRGYSAYLISAYVVTLIKSQTYRRSAHKKLLEYLMHKPPDNANFEIILIRLRTPRKQFLDYKW